MLIMILGDAYGNNIFVYRKEDGCGKRIDMYMNYNKKQ